MLVASLNLEALYMNVGVDCATRELALRYLSYLFELSRRHCGRANRGRGAIFILNVDLYSTFLGGSSLASSRGGVDHRASCTWFAKWLVVLPILKLTRM